MSTAGRGWSWKLDGWATPAYVACAVITALPLFTRLGLAPWPPALVYLAFWVALFGALRPVVRYLGSRPQLSAAVIAAGSSALAAADAVLYPQSRTGPAPSTAPDALIEPARNLLAGRFPYDVALRDAAPASPGPGWVLLNAPLTLAGLVWGLSALWLAVAAVLLERRHRGAGSGFVCILLATLPFVRMSAVGHDLFAVACALAAAALVTDLSAGRSRRLALAGLATGVVATARVPLVVFPLVLAALLAGRDRRQGAVFGGAALGSALSIHGAALAWGHAVGAAYQPLHVFDRAQRGLGIWLLAAGAAAWLGSMAVIVVRADRELAGWLRSLWWSMVLPFGAIGCAELAARGWAWRGWEGSIYLGFPLPLLAAALALRLASGAAAGSSVRAAAGAATSAR